MIYNIPFDYMQNGNDHTTVLSQKTVHDYNKIKMFDMDEENDKDGDDEVNKHTHNSHTHTTSTRTQRNRHSFRHQ